MPLPRRVAVDWGSLRAVILQSDDWGFPGWSTGPGDVVAAEPDVAHYGTSTLESAADVRTLSDLFAGATGRDGLGGVLQANYVTLAPGFAAVAPGEQPPLDAFPEYSAPWSRPGLADAVAAAIARGTWWPEHHAALHCDLERFRARAAAGVPSALGAWRRGRWETEDAAARAEYAASDAHVEEGVAAFRRAFGRSPASSAPPGYVLTMNARRALERAGISVIQAPRRARANGRRLSLWSRAAGRFASTVTSGGVDRTADFEPARGISAESIVARCAREWARGRPSVISTHRANYVNWDESIAAHGLAELERLLHRLAGATFLTDLEAIQLQSSGASVGRRGGRIVVRNYGEATRTLAFSAVRLAQIGVQRAELVCDAAPGETLLDIGRI